VPRRLFFSRRRRFPFAVAPIISKPPDFNAAKEKLLARFCEESGLKEPPAAKEKLLKKFLFGISSKRFTGRRERIAAALLHPPQINPPSSPPIIKQRCGCRFL